MSDEMYRAMQDALTLVEHLGQSADGRLQAQFEDTRNRIADPGVKRTVPPCRTYTHFLQRLSAIELDLDRTGKELGAKEIPEASAAEGDEGLCALAFVRASRDFLAGVAAPATVESIRLTRAFVRHRGRRSRIPLAGLFRFRFWSGVAAPEAGNDADIESRAAKLASRVWGLEMVAIPMVALTLAVSTYALAGHLILERHRLVHEHWRTLDKQLETAETEFAAQLMPLKSGPNDAIVPAGLSGQIQTGTNRFCDRVVRSDGKRDDPAGPRELDRFINPRQIHLCGEAGRAGVDLFTANLYLYSWTSVVMSEIDWQPRLFETPIFRLRVSLAPVFGIVNQSIESFAGSDGHTACPSASLDLAHVTTQKACAAALSALLGSSRSAAESILGALTLYVLPVGYGFLGAVAAIMRMLRTKIEASTLNFTDRNRVRQDAMLGILAGAVIGLFAGSLANTDQSGGAELPALALLAGYNVSGVFRFLDELSDRLFRAGKTGG